MPEDIAIVGMACVFPRAASLQEYWANLAGGVDAVTDVPPDRFRHRQNYALPLDHEAYFPCKRGGFIPSGFLFDPSKYGVMPKLVQLGDADQFLMMHLVDQALRDGGIEPSEATRDRTDILIGRGGYPTTKLSELSLRAEGIGTLMGLIQRRYPELMAGAMREDLERFIRGAQGPKDADSISTAIPNLVASATANRLDFYGASYTVDAACASSLVALDHAVDRLRQGKADVAVAAGLFLNHGPTFWYVLHEVGALSPQGVLRAFDRRADGLVVGEGGGAVVLKRLRDARRDGNRVYALVKGVGVSSDGRNAGLLAPSPVGQIKALQRAYAEARVDPQTIGFLELHGTGTVAGDRAELQTVKRFFGRSARPAADRAMGSVKTMLGHLMPAAGMASLVKMTLALSNKVLPPSLHCEEPLAELADAPFYLITETRPWVQRASRGPRRAAINAFGFGGINVHAVLEEVPPVKAARRKRGLKPRPFRPGLPWPTELLLWSAASTQELSDALRRLAAFLEQDQSGATLADLAATLAAEVKHDRPCKLALVAEDLGSLRTQIARALEALAQLPDAAQGTFPWGTFPTCQAPRDGIWFSAQAARPPGKVAFVFPSVDYLGLNPDTSRQLLGLGLYFPEVRQALDLFEDQSDADAVPLNAILVPPALLPEEFKERLRKQMSPPQNGSSTEAGPQPDNVSPAGIALACWIGWLLLARLRIPADLFVGQSFGEIVALCAAGVADLGQMGPGFAQMLRQAGSKPIDGRSALVLANEDQVRPALAETPGCYVSMHLTPRALVLGGQTKAMAEVVQRLQASGLVAYLLPYLPLHTPLFAEIRRCFAENMPFAEARLRKPSRPVYSSVREAPYPHDPHGIAETALMNFDQPLRLWQTLRKTYQAGARVFVQLSGSDIVAQLPAMLPEGAEAAGVGLDFAQSHPIAQLHRLGAALFACGVPVDATPLHEDAAVRRLDLDAPQPAPQRPRLAMPLRLDWTPFDHPSVPPPPDSPAVPGAADNGSGTPAAGSGTGASGSLSAAAGLATGGQAAHGTPPPQPDAAAGHTIELHPPQPAESQAESLRAMPVLGQIVHLVPDEELVIHRVLHLDDDLFLKDHVFFCAPGIKPVEECMPVVPMTFSLEFLAEAAALLAPGLGLIGFEDIKANRWIALEDETSAELRIEARALPDRSRDGVRAVRGSIYCRDRLSAAATVLFGSTYRQDVQFDLADTGGEGPWPLAAEQIYRERYTFHGPTLQNIAVLEKFGNPACSAQLDVLAHDRLFASQPQPLLVTDPCLLDGVGLLFGLWCQMYGLYALPVGVEKIEFYRPPPTVGARVPVRVEVTGCDESAHMIHANMEVQDGEGGVWARVLRWTDWLFPCPPEILRCLCDPFRFAAASEVALPGLPPQSVCTFLAQDTLHNLMVADSVAKTYLQGAELAELVAVADLAQRQQMACSRLALKDAVRLWWSRIHGGATPHPAQFVLGHDARGRPFLVPEDDPRLPKVSISHTAGAAVALAAARPVGIDLEPVNRQTDVILGEFAAAEEIHVLRGVAAQHPDDTWPTRLWCAKEATAKALGTGMLDRPLDFQLLDAEADGRMLLVHAPTGQRFVVLTTIHEGFVIGHTSLDAEPAPPAPPGRPPS